MAHKQKPKHFDHPYWEVSRIFTPQEAEALLPRVRAGDIKAKQEMVTGYMRLALTIAGLYYAKLKSKRWVDELVDAAMMGVVEGVDRLHKVGDSSHSNPKSLVTEYIHLAISNMLDDDKFIRIPGRTQRDRDGRSEERIQEFSKVSDSDTNDCILYSRISPDADLVELENLIDQIIETDMEATVVALRRDGHNDQEIGDQLGISRQAVQVIRQDLHDRISVLLPERKARNGKGKETPNT
jgi:DNA-directed RNA polymerase specialized sigma subunit